ncbi:hypothetical protein BCR42DRAFT_417458 [Absidia repens]|uniref:VASt domain-containing protein n=1 Tax=Absidia repens TaxID=90262 RepID=A0A1X2IDX7_9FUNG|nr:hypothetical protein BCR42DRAFT_417458 [Absidia repens]
MAHTRLHSNTISNDRSPETDTTSCSNLPRRNSEGPPSSPPDTGKQVDLPGHLSLQHFPDSRKKPPASDAHNNASMAKTSSSLSLPTPVAAPEVPYNETARAAVIPKKEASPIISSQESNGLINTKTTPVETAAATNITDAHASNSSENEDINGSSNNHSSSSFNQPSPHVSDGTEESASEGEHSIATAVRKESISEKRNQEFHSLFRTVPADDSLIEDYGCALQKEILVQGRIYISENYLCFNANIFGWVTNFVIAFSDIVDIEKRTTAIFIPNAIQISTLHAKYTFASFLARDQAFDLIVDVWRYSRPLGNRSSDTSINDTTTSQNDLEEQSSEHDDEDTTDIDDSDYTSSGTETEHEDSNPPSPLPTTHSSSKKMHLKESLRQRSSSAGTKNSGIDDTNNKTAPVSPPNAVKNKSPHPTESTRPVKSAPAAQSTQTKQIKEKTECVCAGTGEHYPNIIMDQVYSGSIETIQNLLYTCGFMKEFLAENEKATDVNMGEWNKSEETKKQTRKSSYIKQLNGSIGPKQTQCLQTEEFTMLTTTQTPDVPSGNSFLVKTRTCLTWAGYGKVRVLVTAAVDFTKSSWLKSTIEKSSIDGQVTYYKHLDAAVKRYMKKHPSEFSIDGTHYKGRKNKGKKHRRKQRKDDYAMRKNESPDDRAYKSAGAQLLGKITEGLKVLFEVIGGIFTTSHLTLFCLTTMVCINLYTAWKMKDVEHHLHGAILASERNGSGILFPSNGRQHHSIEDSLERMYHDELWKWLKSLDTNRPDHGVNAASFTSDGDFSPDDDVDTNTSSDQQILALARMIQQAEKNIGQASRVMEKHRHRIEKTSPDPSLV